MLDYLIAMTVFPMLLIGWVIVQHVARMYAKAHPEFGPPREEGTGCGSHCRCDGGSCEREA